MVGLGITSVCLGIVGTSVLLARYGRDPGTCHWTNPDVRLHEYHTDEEAQELMGATEGVVNERLGAPDYYIVGQGGRPSVAYVLWLGGERCEEGEYLVLHCDEERVVDEADVATVEGVAPE